MPYSIIIQGINDNIYYDAICYVTYIGKYALYLVICTFLEVKRARKITPLLSSYIKGTSYKIGGKIWREKTVNDLALSDYSCRR